MRKEKKKSLRKLKKDFELQRRVEDGQMFAIVKTNNGSHFNVLCTDKIIRIGRLCNSMKKGPRIGVGSYVIVSLRDFETSILHCDIINYGEPTMDIINLLHDGKKENDNINFEVKDEYISLRDLPPNDESIDEKLNWLDL
jgi:translation initiation factor IF-1